jgi:hypothetical protein
VTNKENLLYQQNNAQRLNPYKPHLPQKDGGRFYYKSAQLEIIDRLM